MAPEYGSPIEHLPLIPRHVLKKHKVDEPLDTRFRAAARLLQALWREDRDLPIGTHVGEDGKARKLGSRISEAAGLAGGNFLTPEIARVTRRQVAYREMGAMIDEGRLYTNLLSSMPLAFNLFAPLVQNHERSTGYLSALIPGYLGFVTKLRFEHSPGRASPHFLADHTAFDVFFDYFDVAHGKRGFVAIEVKYSESLREPVPQMRPRYDEVSAISGLFRDPAAPALRANPLQQLWREHMLAQCMVDNNLYDEGYFVVIAPAANHHVQAGVAEYQSHLAEPAEDKVRFVNLTLDDVVESIRESAPDHAAALHRRYLDFWLVDGEIELNEPAPLKRTAPTPEANAGELSETKESEQAPSEPDRRVSGGRTHRSTSD